MVDQHTEYADPESASDSGSTGVSFKGRLRERANRLFSLKFLLFAFLVTSAGLLTGGATFPFPGHLAGLAVASFVLGLSTDAPRTLEIGLAAGATAGFSALFDHLVLAIAGVGVPLVLGTGTGFVLGIVGGYLGGDLRNGLTRDV